MTSSAGLGATDMKGGLAVMIELARVWADRRAAAPLDLAFLFFPREEAPAEESPLPELFETIPELGSADLAILMEPTDDAIHAGCLGHLQARLVVRGAQRALRPALARRERDLARRRAGWRRSQPCHPARSRSTGSPSSRCCP